MAKGDGRGGRRAGAGKPTGSKDRATLEREAAELRAALDAATAAARAAARQPGGSKIAIVEMQKALVLAEGFAGKLQPKLLEDENGKLIVTEADVPKLRLFGDWFDRWLKIQTELAQYQTPKMRAIDAPTPPPDPQELERAQNAPPRKRLTLRIFEGGRLVSGPPDPE